ncbi:threonine synthase [Halorarum halophilum]|uniref:Threonine synthase n=1 Tax=Halorarum halophilum TaxID=2743090 RepID=A0A7D5L2Y3_9EURY|nr:threonine synthase [Halobaculum halophilum]QLG28983.1 threonine synthase [Halobaculum halophilum]
MASGTVCYACGTTYPSTERLRCDCGEPVWIEVDPSGFDWSAVRDGEQGVWRYADLLPVEPSTDVSAGAGDTPLIRAERLDEYAGCRLHVKDEGLNPTGSFKDRGSAVGVGAAIERGRELVGTVSHGNMAMSTAAMAAGRGLDCVVLVPERIPPGRLELIAQYEPTLLKVAGDYGRLYDETVSLDTEPAIEFVNSDAPLRVEGQKTVALELCEAFAPDVPDAIVLPVSSGGHASAVWKGLRELSAAGVVDDLPRLYLVQAAACDPVARAYREGAETVTPVDPDETVAFSISNASPPSGNRALAAVRDTGGAAVSVSEAAITEAQSILATEAGLCVEPASATTLAGVRTLTDEGELAADEDVVVVTTGTGFKELGTGSEPSDARTIDLGDLETELSAIVSNPSG